MQHYDGFPDHLSLEKEATDVADLNYAVIEGLVNSGQHGVVKPLGIVSDVRDGIVPEDQTHLQLLNGHVKRLGGRPIAVDLRRTYTHDPSYGEVGRIIGETRVFTSAFPTDEGVTTVYLTAHSGRHTEAKEGLTLQASLDNPLEPVEKIEEAPKESRLRGWLGKLGLK